MITARQIKHLCFLILVSATFFANAQTVKQKELIILQSKNNHQVHYNCLEKQLLQAFGKPDTNKKYFYEMDEKMGKLIIYQKCKFYLLKNKLIGFELLSPAFKILVGKNSMPIAVSQSAKFPSVVSKKSERLISFNITNENGNTTDQYIAFDLNKKLKVKRIVLGDY